MANPHLDPIPIPAPNVGAIDLPAPSAASVPWHDGEHWHWATPSGEGQILTAAANNEIIFANPGAGLAPMSPKKA